MPFHDVVSDRKGGVSEQWAVGKRDKTDDPHVLTRLVYETSRLFLVAMNCSDRQRSIRGENRPRNAA